MSRCRRSGPASSQASRSAAAVAVTICGSSSHSSVQAAPERSCSWTSAWCIPESCVALKRASATSASAATGLRLCGIAEEPPPPASAISPPSCAISATSCPNLPRLPVTSDSQLAKSAMLSRWLCHCGASARPSRAASAAAHRRLPCRRVCRACPPRRRTARPADRRRLLGQPLAMPFAAAAATRRCGRETRIGIAGCMRVMRHQRVAAEALVRARRSCSIECGEPAVEAARRSASAAAPARCR